MEEIKSTLKAAVSKLFDTKIEPELSRPEEEFGDYSTNIAMQLAAKLDRNPRQVAEEIASGLKSDIIKNVDVAGPGFINITLTDEVISTNAASATNLPKSLKGQEILVEFGDPNPFKEMHIGHLYSYTVGESICRLLENNGASVRRLSYHGDVGLHVAKAIWGMQNSDISAVAGGDMGPYYAKGAKAYDQDEQAKKAIGEINQHIYARDNNEITHLHEEGKAKSFDYFDKILKRIDVRTDRRYLESQSAIKGLELVKGHPEVFKRSNGAIVYEGEKAGLHTRVFVTSQGLPTYEAKDLGLAELKNEDFPRADQSLIITAHEQGEYFKVMLAALSEFDRPTADKTRHISHGFVSLSTGKMSSRSGDVYSAENLLHDVKQAAQKLFPETSELIYIGAVKYGFLRHRLGSDIIYDVEESVSLEGNSGPYLQYAHARAKSILRKAGKKGSGAANLKGEERSLARKIGEYPEVVERATQEFMPSYITTYLYELAQSFNRFYEKNRVIDSDREVERIQLVDNYASVLKHGLELLNIEAPEKV